MRHQSTDTSVASQTEIQLYVAKCTNEIMAKM